MFNWMRRQIQRFQRGRRVKAAYDAAQTNRLNAAHFAMSDNLSAAAANDPSVRATIRERMRYEIGSNPYARGMLDTATAYLVGRGPTLQLTYTGPDSPTLEHYQTADAIESLWERWAESRQLGPKLLQLATATECDGESFALLVNSANLSRTPISLDFRLYECDYFDLPVYSSETDEYAAGVRTNAAGEAIEYAMLEEHPGDAQPLTDDYRWVNASLVLHQFRITRPGQLRGIPRLSASLPSFAASRRFIDSTVNAAEAAADVAAIISSNYVPDEASTDPLAAPRPFHRGMLMEIDDGASVTQLKAEHPNATFDDFCRNLCRMQARPLALPAVLALGDASGYNYASGRLDLQSFERQQSVDRLNLCEVQVLNRLWSAWLDEALLLDDFLPSAFRRNAGDWSIEWLWQSPEHVDRAKEATGQATELASLTTTRSRELARRGARFFRQMQRLAFEQQLIESLGLTSGTSADSSDENEAATEVSDDAQSEE